MKLTPILKADGVTLITAEVRLSYCHLLEPAQINNKGPFKYSVSVLIPKTDTATLALFKKAVDNAVVKGSDKFGSKFTVGRVKKPLRDGDSEEENKPEEYHGHYFFSANAQEKRPPQVIAADGKTLLTDETEIYSGCYARVSINAYAFEGEQKGIAVGLNNVQKIRDGESLGGTKESAFTEFEAIEGEAVDTSDANYVDPMS